MSGPVLTMVGEGDEALLAALEGAGARVERVSLPELAGNEGHFLVVGSAALDGGEAMIARAPKSGRVLALLPSSAAAARLAACGAGVQVIDPVEPAKHLAEKVLAALSNPPSGELGWTELGGLLDAVGDRLLERVGETRRRGLRMRYGEAGPVADALNQFASTLAELCEETKAPDPLGPSVAVAELSWDDDPQTVRRPKDRWQRGARSTEDSAAMILGDLRGSMDALPDADVTSLPSGVLPIPQFDDVTESQPLPLVQRHDSDLAETQEHPSLALNAPPPPPTPDSALDDVKEAAPITPTPLPPPPATPVPPSPISAVPEPKKRGPLLLIAVIALVVGGIGLVVAGVLIGGGFLETEPEPIVSQPDPEAPDLLSQDLVPQDPDPGEPVMGAAEDAAATVDSGASSPMTPDAGAEETAPEPIAPDPNAPDPNAPQEESRERSDALVAEGRTAEQAGDWDAARAAYESAAAAHSANPHAAAGLARERLHANDGEAALVHALRAVSLRRRRASYHVLVGDAQTASGHSGAARRAYQRALELDENNSGARRALGQ